MTQLNQSHAAGVIIELLYYTHYNLYDCYNLSYATLTINKTVI